MLNKSGEHLSVHRRLQALYNNSVSFVELCVFQGKELVQNERVCMAQADGVASLTLSQITADDSGKYIVMAENRFGMDCHYASLAVEGIFHS